MSSNNLDLVRALYARAGLNLETDLQALERAPKVSPDPAAVYYLIRNIVFNGQLGVPVLTMHTIADGFVPVENESAYAAVVQAAGNERNLRQAYVNRAGHCVFTPAETVAAPARGRRMGWRAPARPR